MATGENFALKRGLSTTGCVQFRDMLLRRAGARRRFCDKRRKIIPGRVGMRIAANLLEGSLPWRFHDDRG